MHSQIENYENYREFLADVLLDKTRRNPSFQLRSFAKLLNLSPSMVSSVLNGKKSLSYSRAFEVANHLKLNPEDRSYFCDLVEKESTRSPARRTRSLERIKSFQAKRQNLVKQSTSTTFEEIQLKEQETMGHWYYWALEEMLKLPGHLTLLDFADRLNIPLSNVREALNCLMRIGLVKKNKNNTYSRTEKKVTTTTDVPNKIIAGLHREILQKATEALSTQPVTDRDYSAIVLSIHKKDLGEIKAKIAAFRRELYSYLSDSTKTKNEVYCLSVQFFSMLQNERTSNVPPH